MSVIASRYRCRWHDDSPVDHRGRGCVFCAQERLDAERHRRDARQRWTETEDQRPHTLRGEPIAEHPRW